MQSAECGVKHFEFLMFDLAFKIPQPEFPACGRQAKSGISCWDISRTR
jgi:hypothetical protein